MISRIKLSKYAAEDQSILVIGGYSKRTYRERNLYPVIIDVNDGDNVKFAEYENREDFERIDKALGHFLDGYLVICPQSAKDCTIIENDGIRKISMKVRRTVKALVKLNDTTMWITGGKTREMSTEFVTINGTKEGDNLPFGIEYHCMVKYDTNRVMIIGGNYGTANGQSHIATNKTWIIDTEQKFNVTEGPQLNEGRMAHYCGTLKDTFGNVLIVVISGKKTKGTRVLSKTVEILNATLMDQWNYGKKIFKKLF